MRDYSNMPVITWDNTTNSKKIEAQVLHAEPVIIEMPPTFIMSMDSSACGCKETDNAGFHIDCNAMDTLKLLAEENNNDELLKVAKIAHDAGQVVDIDSSSHRIIIHD